MKTHRSGFVLPVVVVTGTVLLFVLAFVLESIATGRSVTRSNYFQLLSRQAAESGIARAKACLMANERTITWSDEKPLKPNTDCRGNVLPDSPAESQYLLLTPTVRSSFEVKASYVGDDHRNISAVGFSEALRRDGGQVISNYKHKMAAYIKTDVTFNDVVFGSLYVGNGYNDLYNRTGQTAGFSKSVYFFTKTHLGVISGVGHNMDGVVTGYNSHSLIPWKDRYTSDPKEWYHTPYTLPNPAGNTVAIQKIITDFQGNGWITFFLGADGRTIYGTGSNINCDLGLGNCTDLNWQRPIFGVGESKMDLRNIPTNEKVVDIFYNASTYLLTDAGKLYVTGRAGLSPGMGTSAPGSTEVTRPILLRNSNNSFNTKRVKTFYTDSHFQKIYGTLAVATTEDGYLYAWGGGSSAPLNIGSAPSEVLAPNRTIGSQLVGKVVDAVTDGQTIWALTEHGKVLSVGSNRYGQLGSNSASSSSNSFGWVSIPSEEKVTKVTADGFSALFLTGSGNVYGVGLNTKSQLGFPSNTETCRFSGGWFSPDVYTPCSRVPRQFQIPDGKRAIDIFIVSPGVRKDTGSAAIYETEAEYYRNSFVITTDGEVYAAGSNRHGQLGVGAPGDNEYGYGGTPQEFDTPQKMIIENKHNDSGVPGDEEEPARAKYVRSGLGTTIVITDKNHVFTVGNNNYGQLGSGSNVEYHIPKRHRYTNIFKTWYY